MIKIFLIFILLFGITYAGIDILSKLTKTAKISLTKQLAYSTMCAVITITVMTLIVIIF